MCIYHIVICSFIGVDAMKYVKIKIERFQMNSRKFVYNVCSNSKNRFGQLKEVNSYFIFILGVDLRGG